MHTSPPRKFSECAARFLIRPGAIELVAAEKHGCCDIKPMTGDVGILYLGFEAGTGGRDEGPLRKRHDI